MKIENVKFKINEFLTRLRVFESQFDSKLETIGLKERAFKLHPLLAKNLVRIIESIVLIIIFFLLLYSVAWRAPRPFPEHILVTIESGEPLSQIATTFEDENVVRSSFWLKTFVSILGGERNVIAGDYYFPKASSVFGVLGMITKGEFGLSPIKTVVPEGLNSTEIAEVLGATLPKFDKENFIDEAKKSEGYLFPDTYFFMPNAKADDIIAMMHENFARKVNALKDDIDKFNKPLEEVVIMASIVEDEARTIETRRIIAGILWKRLKLKMPLQADATFKYINGKSSFDLTKEDLEDEDNPYNTYANKGLPPTPISNPGIDSIRATVAPTNTDYLFFLSDKNGVMHYAVDFEGHKRNRELYLR